MDELSGVTAQEFITPDCPQQNDMVERVSRTIKEQCIHRQRFDSIQIEIEFAGGHRMRIGGSFDPVALARLIRGLTV